MTTLTVAALDGNLRRYHNAIAAIGPEKARILFARVLNAEGDKMRTKVRRAVAKQTGLKRATVVRAIRRRGRGASPSDLTYELRARGGDIRVKFFRPREFRFGVRAFPRGQATRFAGSFMRGGQFPDRVPIRINRDGTGVFHRTGRGRFPIAQTRSGVFIPDELVTGASEAAFNATPDAMMRQIDRQLGAIFRGF